MMREYKEGSNNIFKDLGCSNPDEKLVKAEIAFIINKIIKERKLTQKEAAKILGIDQPKISALKHGKLSGFSIERLFSFLRALDQCIDIVVHNKSQGSENRMIHVAYA
jgi:predicted XRE-type DNA-binding protein